MCYYSSQIEEHKECRLYTSPSPRRIIWRRNSRTTHD